MNYYSLNGALPFSAIPYHVIILRAYVPRGRKCVCCLSPQIKTTHPDLWASHIMPYHTYALLEESACGVYHLRKNPPRSLGFPYLSILRTYALSWRKCVWHLSSQKKTPSRSLGFPYLSILRTYALSWRKCMWHLSLISGWKKTPGLWASLVTHAS